MPTVQSSRFQSVISRCIEDANCTIWQVQTSCNVATDLPQLRDLLIARNVVSSEESLILVPATGISYLDPLDIAWVYRQSLSREITWNLEHDLSLASQYPTNLKIISDDDTHLGFIPNDIAESLFPYYEGIKGRVRIAGHTAFEQVPSDKARKDLAYNLTLILAITVA